MRGHELGANELSLACERTLERVLAPVSACTQPRLLDLPTAELTAAICSLALGGAERIVLDWAGHCARRHRVRLVVLRDAGEEWNVPAGVELNRLHGRDVHARLKDLGADLALRGHRAVYCHLLTRTSTAY